MNIVIAGAGIGGLTTALCLARDGHHVTLLERKSEFLELGAGLQCGANAMRVLLSLGLGAALEEYAVAPGAAVFRHGISGAQFHSAELGASYASRYGAPYYHLHRAHLQQVLVDAVRQESSIEIHMNSRVETFKADVNHVRVRAGSLQLEADCLIGADGIRSAVRTQMNPGVAPRKTGNVAWRGVIDVSRLPSDFMPLIATNFVGPGRHMVVYYVDAGQLLNFVGVVENRRSDALDWVSVAPWQELKEDFSGWHPMVQTLIDAVDRHACYRWTLCDLPTMSTWTQGRVALLGDAAHATLPFMASGAALAIEDARVLQRSLAAEPNLPMALKFYQNTRRARAHKVQRDSARVGRLYHLSSAWLQKQLFGGLSIAAQRQARFLAEYDANHTRLVSASD
ncbi:monooxygenase [Arenicella chitinivorans]|uniref:Monooxygenase n=1 Tax=Arenicella chitinivorans TaxID=1329800 RepID=A0A918VHH5_9GAMM|nr:FAD-dependent oxidoreductase [Arenicella chitinivorans]GGZ98126.1 monooxygenase [Arenicella chitinivorans]